MLRFFLPPNLATAAARNGIAVRVEADLTKVPAPEIVPGLALLQRWSGAAAPPQFVQLTRTQLRELVAALRGQAVFYWVQSPRQPIPWQASELAGVSSHLSDPAPTSVAVETPARPPIEVPRSVPTSSPAVRRRVGSIVARERPEPNTPLTIDGSEHYLAISLPSRESAGYAAALDLVKSSGFMLEPSNRKWWLRDRHKVLNFLSSHGERLRREGNAEFTSNFERNTANLRPAEVIAEAAATGDDFAVTLGLRAGDADEAQIRAAVASNRGYLESRGKVFLLDATKLTRLAEAQQALAGQPGGGFSGRQTFRVSSARIPDAQAILEELSPSFEPPEKWRQRGEALRDLTQLPSAPLSPSLDTQLRPYQRLGVAWLWHLYRHQLGGILADEMGLGKTLQALGLLTALHPSSNPADSRPRDFARATARPSQPSLVICPASLLENWRREAARFASDLRVFVHHGEKRLSAAEDFQRVDLVITSYGTLTRDRERFSEIEFTCVIADEAQHIKNRRSQNAAALRSLRSRGRFLLTGTPLENSLDDLRSLFEFLLPGYISRVPDGLRGEERTWFDQRLRAQTAPYILRRTKQAVAPELPPKLEQVIWCDLAPAQARLYRDYQEKSERDLFDLEAGGASENQLRLAALTQLLRLRQICCDPRLVGPDRTTERAADDGVPSERAAAVRPTAAKPFGDSAKLDAFRELLDEVVDDGHRVLVFSQFTSLLSLLREDLEQQGITYTYLDGSMSGRARQAEVDRFQSDPTIPVFLLSLKAGGTGLNLTGADTVIHFDPWWNPAAEAQATDRAHRIGQSRAVTSYKLVATNTVEEKVLGLQDEKRSLLAGVFEASDAVSSRLSVTDLKSLLAIDGKR